MDLNKEYTIYDVARRAKVSIATVSRVQNGNPKGISDKTRRRVEKIIDKLGYYPDLGARSLGRKNTGKKKKK